MPSAGFSPFARVSACRSEEHTSELQSRPHLVCRLLLEKKKTRCCAPNHGRCRLRGKSLRTVDSGARQSLMLPARYRFFFNDPATTEIYTLSLHDALPIQHGKLGAEALQHHLGGVAVLAL